jgi:hypothetical protein
VKNQRSSHPHQINGRYKIHRLSARAVLTVQRREPKGEDDSDESSEEEESEEESEEEETAPKPVLANENPNHVKKGPIKATAVKGPPPELTRRERYFKPFRRGRNL